MKMKGNGVCAGKNLGMKDGEKIFDFFSEKLLHFL